MEQKTLARWLKIVLAGVGICGLLVFLLLVPVIAVAAVIAVIVVRKRSGEK